jgi:hypothetical protein
MLRAETEANPKHMRTIHRRIRRTVAERLLGPTPG